MYTQLLHPIRYQIVADVYRCIAQITTILRLFYNRGIVHNYHSLKLFRNLISISNLEVVIIACV